MNHKLGGYGEKIGLKKIMHMAHSIRPEAIIEFSEWVTTKTLLKGKPFSFEKHEYQQQILDDTSSRMCVRKSVQLGVSEILVRKFLAFLAMYQGTQGIYTFPTSEEVGQFVKTRVDPVITECTKIEELGFNVDNVKIKQIGKSFAHFRGSFGERETIAIPSDFNVHDEIDFSKPNIQNLYRSRMEHSEYAFEISCSTPTISMFGVDELFMASSQNYWHIKCPHCNFWQYLIWWPTKDREKDSNIRSLNGIWDVEKGDWAYVCKKCGKQIGYDPFLVPMQWVTKYSGKSITGYSLNALVGWGYKKAGAIVKSFFEYKEIEKAYNRILGLPYTAPGKKVTRAQIFKCMDNKLKDESTGRQCFMGADQAVPLVIIGNLTEAGKIRIVHFERIEKNVFDQVGKDGRIIKGRLGELMEEYDVLAAVIDAQPNTESATQFAKNFAGRAWTCFYSDKQFEKMHWKDNLSVVSNRNRTIETAMQYWLDRKVEIFSQDNYNLPIYERFIENISSLTKVVDEDKDGRKTARWLTPKGCDFAHVWNYLCMALEAEVSTVSRIMTPGISGFSMKRYNT